MRGSFGLVIGVIVGAGAMYLVLRPPWERRGATIDGDRPPVVVVSPDAGVKPVPKKRRPHRVATPAQPAEEPGGEAERDEPQITLGAADRALEWRGDDVVLPPRTIDLAGGGNDARALSDDEIQATIHSEGSAVTGCVVQGATGTDLRATITIKLVVDGRGRVSKSRIQAPHYLFEHGLSGCAQRALGRLRFPATGAPTLVTLPIDLGR